MKERLKNFSKKFGEGTSWDLDYGKLVIIGLLIYHIFIQQRRQIMISTKAVKKAIKRIDQYCNENDLNGHHFARKILMDELATFIKIKKIYQG